VKRATAAKERAEEALKSPAADLDYDATLNALKRAEIRLRVALYASRVTTTH